MTGAPLDRHRVAQLVVTRAGGRHRGSGYRIRADAVLTAAHLVRDAESVSLRFGPGLAGEWEAGATSWWVDPASDIAVVVFDPRPDEHLVAPRFGSIKDGPAVLPVVAVGFPLWKLRPDAEVRPFRDSVQADGKVPVLSNWREGTLEVVVDEPPNARDDDLSPWQGMSGAALWSGGHIVGVIVKHHPGDGLARLAAARLDLALDHVDPAHGTTLREVLGVVGALPDTGPASRSEVIAGEYRAVAEESAPELLHDREHEIDELVRFCADDEPYAWWQAGPWAGKSALLGWFALHPPAGVDVVSFFVNGRHAGESDSDAYLEALVEQLTAMTDTSVESARPNRRQMLHLLETAAGRCHAAGRTLLLVVDGLDEDTSKRDGLSRPSIASLLPLRARPGLRVLVASRPHPDLPPDVDPAHPLRTVVPRGLTPSPHARGLKIAADWELRRLLDEVGPQHDLVGLITASGGGLTERDLRELLGRSRSALATLFGSTVGRSVGAVTSRGQSERVYVFTHDTLREQAEHWFEDDIADYRAKLHDWADTYRERGWPADTPVYLLRGYPGLMAARGEVDRLVACALDRSRHDRMLAVTGGDGLAMTEISSAAGLLAGAPEPDLGQLLRVAVTAMLLKDRNSFIPDDLPKLWARLGHADRAIALVDSLARWKRVDALVDVIAELKARGDDDRVPVLAEQVESAFDLTTYDDLMSYRALCKLTLVLADGDTNERSRKTIADLEAMARQIDSTHRRDRLLSDLAHTAFLLGDHERASALIASLSEDFLRVDVVGGLPLGEDVDLTLRYLKSAGSPRRTERLRWKKAYDVRADPEQALRFLSVTGELDAHADEHLHVLAADAVQAGYDERALKYLLAMERPGDVIPGLLDRLAGAEQLERMRWWAAGPAPEIRVHALSLLAMAHAGAGEVGQAEEHAAAMRSALSEVADPRDRAIALSRLAAVARYRGDRNGAAELFRAAVVHADQIHHMRVRIDVLTTMVELATRGGDTGLYTEVANAAEERITGLGPFAATGYTGFGSLARTAVTAGDENRARRLIEVWLRMVAEVAPERWDSRFDRALIGVAAEIGAFALVPGLLARDPEAARLRTVVEAALAKGDVVHVGEVAAALVRGPAELEPAAAVRILVEVGEDDLALAEYRSSPAASNEKDERLAAAAEAVALAGDDERALRLITALAAHQRGTAFKQVVEALAARGHLDRAARFVAEMDEGYKRSGVLRLLTRAAAEHGDIECATRFIEQVQRPWDRARSAIELAEVLATAGELGPAADWCFAAERLARSEAGNRALAQVRAQLASVLGTAADIDRAERLVRSVSSGAPGRDVLVQLALCVLEWGNEAFARALATEAARTEPEDSAFRSQTRLLDALVRTGAAEEAESVVAEVEGDFSACRDDFERSRVVNDYIKALASVGRHSELLEYADVAADLGARVHALTAVALRAPEEPVLGEVRARIRATVAAYLRDPRPFQAAGLADALAAIGEFALLEDMLERDLEPSVRLEIVQALLTGRSQDPRNGRTWTARCEAVARQLGVTFYRNLMLGRIAAAHEKNGDHGEAVRVAGLISDVGQREGTLREFRLKAIADGRDVVGAREYVAEVLTIGIWEDVLEAVAKIDLPVLQRFADEVVG